MSGSQHATAEAESSASTTGASFLTSPTGLAEGAEEAFPRRRSLTRLQDALDETATDKSLSSAPSPLTSISALSSTTSNAGSAAGESSRPTFQEPFRGRDAAEKRPPGKGHARRHSQSRPAPEDTPRKSSLTKQLIDAAWGGSAMPKDHARSASPSRNRQRRPRSAREILVWAIRMLRSPRKCAGLLVGLLICAVVGSFAGRLLFGVGPNGGLKGGLRVGPLSWGRSIVDEAEAIDPGECHFVSPVEAYNTALRRLRQQKHREADDYETEDPADSFFYANHRLSSSKSAVKQRRSAHVYSPTGHLLIADPGEQGHDDSGEVEHPIPQLLALGERRWEEMLERQSRTLGEACAEYTRRYGRKPPMGFDLWWEFAMTHNLILPDEYDRINLDLAPFWALPRAEMRKRVEEVEKLPQTFTLNIKGGNVEIEILDKSGLDWGGTYPRAVDAASLLRSFSRFLPDMKAVFSIFDQPQIYLSWARRSSLVELGLRGEHTTHLKETDDANVRWSRSCAPDSNLRKRPDLNEPNSLVFDAGEASDLCQNPYLLDYHGLTVEKHGPSSHPRPHTALMPLFSLAKMSINSDILITPLDQFASKVGKDPKWEDKTDSRLVWRGSTTGISWMDRNTPWRKSHRFRLHFHAQNISDDEVPVLTPNVGTDSGPLKLQREHYSVSELSDFYYDMRLAGQPLQCNETDGTCDRMLDEVDFAPYQSPEEMNQYKFQFDIDGNGWSGRFRRLMSTNSLILKAGIFTEWFQPHLIPWFMYIPTRMDFADLPTILAFFRGTPEAPDDGFDEVAKAVAQNGKCFIQRMYRVQDLQAYMLRLFLEYARLTAEDGVEVDFEYQGELEDDWEDEDPQPTSKKAPAGTADSGASVFSDGKLQAESFEDVSEATDFDPSGVEPREPYGEMVPQQSGNDNEANGDGYARQAEQLDLESQEREDSHWDSDTVPQANRNDLPQGFYDPDQEIAGQEQ